MTRQDMDRRRRNVYSQEEKTEAWSKAAEMVQAHSDEMITLWKEEIDTYLVFVRRRTALSKADTSLID